MGMMTDTMKQLTLFYQPDCHLCEEAETLMRNMGLSGHCKKVDIETDLELLKRYGIHVPVLLREHDQQELFWPFGEWELADFVAIE